MIGQLLCLFYLLYVLIISTVVHSFITQGIIERLRLAYTLINYIFIEMLDKDKILSNQMLLGGMVTLRG